MRPIKDLPYGEAFDSVDTYVDSLLDVVKNHKLLGTLCGGVHVLDFFTNDPDLYCGILSQTWRDFFARHHIMDILDLLMREDLEQFLDAEQGGWRDGPAPPPKLLEYILLVRKHLLVRKMDSSQSQRTQVKNKLSRQVSVGMNVKKVHEVGQFASYVDELVENISSSMDQGRNITHLVDFGSGQSYLGRALASEPYNRHVVAIESKARNAERAKEYDVRARLVEKKWLMRNKKTYRASVAALGPDAPPTPPPEPVGRPNVGMPAEDKGGAITHVEQRILGGDLTDVVGTISCGDAQKVILMVISLHSCGNLVHHGLRSLTFNPSVKAVAMVGCCYNLLTERLGPATYKLPELRPTAHEHARLKREGEARDPDGFPMSARFCGSQTSLERGNDVHGVRLNITARMMGVQAPANWGAKDSDAFFTRHFYRALLQRVFLDRGVVGPPSAEFAGASPSGHSSGGTPIIIGSLRKSCYNNFVSYTHGALAKLYDDAHFGTIVKEKMSSITDVELEAYEIDYQERKKELSVMWSLMAFSAGVVEAAIVVDRYLWLKEQQVVKEAWVEPIFDYAMSPRNLVVVGVKR